MKNEITIIYKGVGGGIEHETFEGKDAGCKWREGCVNVFGDDCGLVIPIERLISVTYRLKGEGSLDNHKE